MPGTLTVLVVDDDAGIRETMSDILTLEGYSVETADGGPAAVALCTAKHFHFVLLDIRMHQMNGVETSAHQTRRSCGARDHDHGP